MGLNAKKVESTPMGSTQEPLEAGTYNARIVQVIDLGVQDLGSWEGVDKGSRQKIQVTYELVDEFCLDEDGNEIEDKPRWISEEFPFHSLEMDNAKSTKRYNAIDPDGDVEGDWAQLLGWPVVVTIVQKKAKKGDKVYANVVGVSRPRKKDIAKIADLVNEPRFFSPDEPDMDVWDDLPQWLQKKIISAEDHEDTELCEKLVDHKPKKKEKESEEEEKPKKKPAKKPAKKKPVKKKEPEPEEEEEDEEPPFDPDEEEDWD